ncbi:MAG: hypothetical protein JO222_09540 [Frankiales bacterium]|nr:hypothetical protein [Frankiales bacterium]
MRVLAHAFGKRYDLPIPLYLFVIGGALVVLVSFAIVAGRGGAKAEPADRDAADGAHLRPLFPVAGVVATLWLAFICWCGFVGSQLTSENIIATWFWIVVWIAVPLSVAVVGDWTQPVNPFAFLAKLANSGRLRQSLLGSDDVVRWPRRLGWWVAVAVFFTAASFELVFNLWATTPHITATLLTAYAAVSLVGGFLFGDEWLRRGEMFTVLYDTWGRLGYFRFGAPGRRGFAGGLEEGFSRHPSRIAFVLLMLLNVNFDGLLATPQWTNDVLDRLPASYAQPGTSQRWFNVAAFLALAVVLALLLTGFAQGSARAGEHRTRPSASLTGLLPSLVPIAFGYLLAHNLEYLLVNGQLLFPLLGKPTGLDGWPIHLGYPFSDSYDPSRTFLPSAFYWYVSLVVIIAVHVYAVVIAHRHLVRVAPDERRQRRSEYPWLVAMVGYTCLSLWLLAQPLTAVSSTTTASPPSGATVPATATVSSA